MGYNFFNIKPVKDSFNRKLSAFITSFGPALCEGKDITFADNDITYTLKLQNERIKDKNLEMEYSVYSREKGEQPFITASSWQDEHYESAVCFKFCGVKRCVKQNGKKIYKDDRRSVIYETVTDVLIDSHPDNDTYVCPNCGAPSTIAELQNGCKYCGTCYKMDDLFPKVTGYYFLDDVGTDNKEVKKLMPLFMIACAVLIFIYISVYVINIGDAANLSSLIGAGIGSLFGGVILGYFAFSIFLLLRIIFKGVSTSGKMGTAGSRNAFEKRMKKISPEFSFEYFTSKAISLIKTAVYSKNEEELLFYKGKPLADSFKNIIDLNYGGALGLEKFKEDDNIVTVVTKAYFDVLYEENKKVSFKHQVFKATFQRRTDVPVDFNFSMTRISCPTCGSSFDATKNKFCPSCGNEYEIISDDWILTELVKM